MQKDVQEALKVHVRWLHKEMVSISTCGRHCASELMPGIFFRGNTIRVHKLGTLIEKKANTKAKLRSLLLIRTFL